MFSCMTTIIMYVLDILKKITNRYNDKTIWRVMVRDVVNQLTRNERYRKTLQSIQSSRASGLGSENADALI